MERWGGSGRRQGRENHDQTILHKNKLFSIKKVKQTLYMDIQIHMCGRSVWFPTASKAASPSLLYKRQMEEKETLHGRQGWSCLRSRLEFLSLLNKNTKDIVLPSSILETKGPALSPLGWGSGATLWWHWTISMRPLERKAFGGVPGLCSPQSFNHFQCWEKTKRIQTALGWCRRRGITPWVVCLPSLHEALGPSPSTTENLHGTPSLQPQHSGSGGTRIWSSRSFSISELEARLVLDTEDPALAPCPKKNNQTNQLTKQTKNPPPNNVKQNKTKTKPVLYWCKLTSVWFSLLKRRKYFEIISFLCLILVIVMITVHAGEWGAIIAGVRGSWSPCTHS